MLLIKLSLALLASQDIVAQLDDQLLRRTSEQERAAYLDSHSSKIAVIPGAISREVASQLTKIVDRQWSHVNMSYVAEIEASGGDEDELVDVLDFKANYVTPVICNERCPCSAVKIATNATFRVGDEDCDLAQRLLQQNIIPLVEQKTKEWKLRDGTDEFDDLLLCESFVKRYLPGERHEMSPHRDARKLTVNILLNDPDEFEGGLAVYPDSDERMERGFLTEDEERGVSDVDKMGRPVYLEHGQDSAVGEIIMHRGSLWHGVDVLQPEQSRRYSWISWFSKYCEPDEDEEDEDGLGRKLPLTLSPTCGPANLDLCDDVQKADIAKISRMSASELQAAIVEKTAVMQKLVHDSKEFLDAWQFRLLQLEQLQLGLLLESNTTAYEMKDKDVEEIKNSGLGLMNAVPAYNKAPKSEL